MLLIEHFLETKVSSFVKRYDIITGSVLDTGWEYFGCGTLRVAYQKTIQGNITIERLVIFEKESCEFLNKKFINEMPTKNYHKNDKTSAKDRRLWEPVLKKFRTIFKPK